MAGTTASLATGEAILELRSLRKAYGDLLAVDDVSLSIPRGSIYGFLGPNGAGKTTTIRSVMGIVMPDTGEVILGGEPMSARLRDRVGYLPEERGLYRKMKTVEQLAYLAELKSIPRKEALRRAGEWLDRVGLGDWKQNKVDELSKGMQQKIQFAATFIFEPDLVILDEPFSGLDPLNIELLRDIILEQREAGVTVIFSTHMLAEAEKLCDFICLIEGGQKILDGSLADVRAQFPLRVVKVALADGAEPAADLPFVKARSFDEGIWHLTIDADADTDVLLDALRRQCRLTLFSADRPSVSDIFLSAVERHRGGGRS